MNDYILTIRYGARNDTDAEKVADTIRKSIGNGWPDHSHLGRYVDCSGPSQAMLTRDIVARPLPERL